MLRVRANQLLQALKARPRILVARSLSCASPSRPVAAPATWGTRSVTRKRKRTVSGPDQRTVPSQDRLPLEVRPVVLRQTPWLTVVAPNTLGGRFADKVS
jgi:hypothetical protein